MSKQNDEKKSSRNSQAARSVRMTACDILVAVAARDAFADKLLDHARTDFSEPRDRNLLTEIVKGVIRHRRYLDWRLQKNCRAKIRKLPHAVLAAMRAALYQLTLMDRIPPHAAINEAVAYTRARNGNRLTGMVNAVLRAANDQEAPPLPETQTEHLGIKYSHPDWLVERWIKRFGADQCAQLLAANNTRAPLCLRANLLRNNRDDLRKTLETVGLQSRAVEFQEDCLYLDSPGVLEELPAFVDGACTVQDAGAAAVVRLAAPKPGQRVLDLCSAPGGKSLYAAEIMQNSGHILAVDLHANKLPLIDAAAARMGVSIVETMQADATTLERPEKADLILIDAPCSGLGTLQGKPEIKWRRTLDDLKELADLQLAILTQAAKLLADGGTIVYSTCTTEPEENRMVVESFLKSNPEFRVDPAEQYLPPTICNDGALETLPHVHGCDGTFGIRLRYKQENQPKGQ